MGALQRAAERRRGLVERARIGGGDIRAEMRIVVPSQTRGARGVGAGAGLGGVGWVIGDRLARRHSLLGDSKSVARSLPLLPNGTALLYATDTELFVVAGPVTHPRIAWRVSTDRIRDIHKSVRYQLMAKFRITFDDDSSLVFMTFRAHNVRRLQAALTRDPGHPEVRTEPPRATDAPPG